MNKSVKKCVYVEFSNEFTLKFSEEIRNLRNAIAHVAHGAIDAGTDNIMLAKQQAEEALA